MKRDTPGWWLRSAMAIAGLVNRPHNSLKDRPADRPNRISHARKLLAGPEVTIKEVAASPKVSRATIYGALWARRSTGQAPGRAGKPAQNQSLAYLSLPSRPFSEIVAITVFLWWGCAASRCREHCLRG